jgi:hypothetical protein
VHDPLRLPPPGRPPPVEHQRLAHPHQRPVFVGGGGDGAVLAGGLPVARSSGAVGAVAGGVLAVAQAEEVPLVPFAHAAILCSNTKYIFTYFMVTIKVSWCSWLSRQSNTLKVSGSNPGEAKCKLFLFLRLLVSFLFLQLLFYQFPNREMKPLSLFGFFWGDNRFEIEDIKEE